MRRGSSSLAPATLILAMAMLLVGGYPAEAREDLLSGDLISYGQGQATVTLQWAGTTGFTSDGVEPDSGDPTTLFEWRVRYEDSEGHAPAAGYPKVHILEGGVDIAGSPFTMAAAPAGGGLYYYNTTLAAGTDYSHYFEAQCSEGEVATGEATVETAGPDVIPDSCGIEVGITRLRVPRQARADETRRLAVAILNNGCTDTWVDCILSKGGDVVATKSVLVKKGHKTLAAFRYTYQQSDAPSVCFTATLSAAGDVDPGNNQVIGCTIVR